MHPCAGSDLILGTVLLGCYSSLGTAETMRGHHDSGHIDQLESMLSHVSSQHTGQY